MRTYTKDATIQFVEDMDLLYDVEHYHGRFYWEGPAVRVENASELSDVLAATSVPCQWDQLGLGFIVYPRVSDKGIED